MMKYVARAILWVIEQLEVFAVCALMLLLVAFGFFLCHALNYAMW